MAQADKSRLYQALKSAGYVFTKHFREYTVAELEAIHQNIADRISEQTGVPVQEKNESEQPSQRLGGFKGPIRTDMQGRVWYQEEIIKSSIAKPRGYRVYREIGSNTKQVTVDSGDGYTETFEVPGDERKPLEVKVGVPTWQVGIYKDPRLPFKIMTYRNARGYVREEVENFFGGKDVLPESISVIYVGNRLCYSIRSVNTAIQREYNMLQKKGSVV